MLKSSNKVFTMFFKLSSVFCWFTIFIYIVLVFKTYMKIIFIWLEFYIVNQPVPARNTPPHGELKKKSGRPICEHPGSF